MIAAQRRQKILDSLRIDGVVTISLLARELGVSEVTVRRDLDYLDSTGTLTRTHGGAVSGQHFRESSYAEKISQAAGEKQAIGKLAGTLVHDGDVIILGPGTTTEALARHLCAARSGLTVFTNSLLVATAFADAPENEVVMTGGTLRAAILALVGETTNRTFRRIHASSAFLSGNGLVPDFGLSTPNLAVADADRAMAAAAQHVVVLADHTKIGVRSAIQTVPADSITHLVTDAGVSDEDRRAFSARGIEVDVADPEIGL